MLGHVNDRTGEAGEGLGRGETAETPGYSAPTMADALSFRRRR